MTIPSTLSSFNRARPRISRKPSSSLLKSPRCSSKRLTRKRGPWKDSQSTSSISNSKKEKVPIIKSKTQFFREKKDAQRATVEKIEAAVYNLEEEFNSLRGTREQNEQDLADAKEKAEEFNGRYQELKGNSLLDFLIHF